MRISDKGTKAFGNVEIDRYTATGSRARPNFPHNILLQCHFVMHILSFVVKYVGKKWREVKNKTIYGVVYLLQTSDYYYNIVIAVFSSDNHFSVHWPTVRNPGCCRRSDIIKFIHIIIIILLTREDVAGYCNYLL